MTHKLTVPIRRGSVYLKRKGKEKNNDADDPFSHKAVNLKRMIRYLIWQAMYQYPCC